MPDCNECQQSFDTWEALALHIMSHKDHRKGRIWASKVLVQVDNIHEHKERLPEVEHTAYGDEQREKYSREISGEMKSVRTVCPDCKQVDYKELHIEYDYIVLQLILSSKISRSVLNMLREIIPCKVVYSMRQLLQSQLFFEFYI